MSQRLPVKAVIDLYALALSGQGIRRVLSELLVLLDVTVLVLAV